MKRLPPLLPTLALISLAGAAIFLTITAPSCGPQRDVEAASPTAQERAFVAAAGTPVTADDDFRPAAGPGTANTSARSFAETARMQVARRDFLMNAARWQDGDRPGEIKEQAASYRWTRRHWLRWMLEGHRGIHSPLPGKLTSQRKVLDRLCADRSLLTAEARSEWEMWEAKSWSGYEVADSLDVDGVFAETKENAVRILGAEHSDHSPDAEKDFRRRRDALVLPLVNQLEQLDDDSFAPPPLVLFNAATEKEETPAQAAERRRQSDLAAELRGKLDDVMSQSRLFAGRWEIRRWEGYIVDTGNSGGLPEPPKP